jgi:hypothetical protein
MLIHNGGTHLPVCKFCIPYTLVLQWERFHRQRYFSVYFGFARQYLVIGAPCPSVTQLPPTFYRPRNWQRSDINNSFFCLSYPRTTQHAYLTRRANFKFYAVLCGQHVHVSALCSWQSVQAAPPVKPKHFLAHSIYIILSQTLSVDTRRSELITSLRN